jgi:hypothetical protein
MAALQTKPYGTVPALTGVVEYRYAYADEAIGVDAMKGGYPKVAIRYFTIEQSILQSYADEGGSASLMRQAQTGWVADAALDRELQSLYQQVMPQLISSYRAAGNAAAADRATVTARNYYRAFANILRKSSST